MHVIWKILSFIHVKQFPYVVNVVLECMKVYPSIIPFSVFVRNSETIILTATSTSCMCVQHFLRLWRWLLFLLHSYGSIHSWFKNSSKLFRVHKQFILIHLRDDVTVFIFYNNICFSAMLVCNIVDIVLLFTIRIILQKYLFTPNLFLMILLNL